MVKPRQVEPQGPLLSTKGPFVQFDPVDSTIRGNKAKTDYRNIILEINIILTLFVTRFLDGDTLPT